MRVRNILHVYSSLHRTPNKMMNRNVYDSNRQNRVKITEDKQELKDYKATSENFLSIFYYSYFSSCNCCLGYNYAKSLRVLKIKELTLSYGY